MKEQKLEQKLKAAVTEIGGLCWKFVSPGTAGVPDRICVFGGRVVFVEVKTRALTPRPLQTRRIKQLQAQGITVIVLDRVDGIKEVLHALQAA